MSFKFDINDQKCIVKSEHQFTNNWNHKISVRPFIQEDDKVILFYQHGMLNHSNRVLNEKWAARLHKKQIAIIFFDHVSHGQSDYIDGEWGQFNNLDELDSTVNELIEIILGHKKCETISCIKKNLPFLIGGLSMGGGLTAIAAKQFENKSKQSPELYQFKGSIQIAAAFDGTKPHDCVIAMLRCVANTIPKTTVPSFLKEEIVDLNLMTNHIDEFTQAEQMNTFFTQKSLQFGVALFLIDMIQKIVEIKGLTSPVLIMHDPDDKVTQYSAAKKFYEDSTSVKNKFVDFKGEKHDLVFNCFDLVNDHIEDFIENVMN